MRVLVAGAGAIGQWLGARLAREHDVTLLLRPRFRDAIASGGLQVRGETLWEGKLPCVAEPTGGPFDAVFLTCKAHQSVELGRQVAPLVAKEGVLCSLQNGLGNVQKLLHFLEPERVAVALTSHGVTVEAPGRLLHAGVGPTLVGPSPGCEDAGGARRVESLLSDARLAPQWRAHMRPAVWTKAAVNAGINPVAAVAGVPNGALLEEPLRSRALALLDEVVALSRAAGVALTGDVGAAFLATCENTADNRCSMLQDVEAKRPTEVEQITGRLVRLSRALGYPMEVSEAMYREVKALEASYLGEEEAMAMARREAEWSSDPF